MIKVVFAPGNGGSTTRDNWFPSLQKTLEEAHIQVVAPDFPDPELARESYWIPFLRDTLKVDDQTVIVGHSSGAIAAMRMAQTQKILGSVLVGAYHTDLNMETEKASGYFETPWDWPKMRKNQQWCLLFASQDDPWIPVHEARFVHEQLNCEYHEFTDQGHFGGDYFKPDFPELSHALVQRLKNFP